MSYDIVKEDVPAFTKRVGDHVIAGSNNSMLVLGTDRPGGIDTGYGDTGASSGGRGAGSALLVVGRRGRDPNFREDAAFLYISMRTDVDANLGLDVEGATNDVSGGIFKADSVRIVCRRDLKISVGSSYLVLKSDGTAVFEGQIKLGKDAAEKLVKQAFVDNVFPLHVHGGGSLPNGNTGPVIGVVPPSVLTRKVSAE